MKIRETNDFVPRWNSNHDGYRAIFNAALTGICANPHFFGFTHQGNPQSAVEFANEVTLAAIYGSKYVPPHLRAENTALASVEPHGTEERA